MCNLYSLVTSQAEIREAFGVEEDRAGNLPRMPGIFPDQMAPIVRIKDGRRALEMFRWGIPGPKQYGEHPVTNVRNVKSPHWRPWLKPEYRCLVPVSSFSEYADTKPKKTPTWFALDDARAGLCLRRHLAPLDGRARHQGREPRPRGGRAPAILVPHLRCEWHRWPGPPEGDAGPADDARGVVDVA